jgi:uncharacterized membrane protein required for colicin V production
MPFDLFCLALLLLFAIRGAFRGFVRQLFGVLGLAGGIMLARLAAPSFGEAFGSDLDMGPTVATAMLAAALFITAELVARYVGKRVHEGLGGGAAGWINRVGGGLLGSAKGFLAVWALASLIALVRPSLKRVERDTPIAKLDLKESFAIQTSTRSNLVTQLRESDVARGQLGSR